MTVVTVMTIVWDNTSIILKYNFNKNVFMGLERGTNEAYDTSNSGDTDSSDTNDTDGTNGTNDTSDAELCCSQSLVPTLSYLL